MAISSTASIAAGAITQWKYDVFVNFRGGDTRRTFLSHLHDALLRAELKTFIDEDLRRGKDISAFLEAIEDSNVAVAIFSKDYASSPWCLDELVKIIESSEYRGQTVIPVFYDVRASVVQVQSETYAEAFTKHQKDPKNARRVPIWKGALTKAAKIARISARNTRTDAELVKEIVNEILIILGRKSDGMDKVVKIELSINAGSVSSFSELQAPIGDGGMDRAVKTEESKNAGSVSSSAELQAPIGRPECRDDKNSHPRGNPPHSIMTRTKSTEFNQGSQQRCPISSSSSMDGNGTQIYSDKDTDTSPIVYFMNM